MFTHEEKYFPQIMKTVRVVLFVQVSFRLDLLLDPPTLHLAIRQYHT